MRSIVAICGLAIIVGCYVFDEEIKAYLHQEARSAQTPSHSQKGTVQPTPAPAAPKNMF